VLLFCGPIQALLAGFPFIISWLSNLIQGKI